MASFIWVPWDQNVGLPRKSRVRWNPMVEVERGRNLGFWCNNLTRCRNLCLTRHKTKSRNQASEKILTTIPFFRCRLSRPNKHNIGTWGTAGRRRKPHRGINLTPHKALEIELTLELREEYDSMAKRKETMRWGRALQAHWGLVWKTSDTGSLHPGLPSISSRRHGNCSEMNRYVLQLVMYSWSRGIGNQSGKPLT